MGSKVAKWVGLFSLLAGLIMIIAGATTWGVITSQLNDEKITVPADGTCMAGKHVGGPITAYCQADTIKHHAMKSSGGLTYAELGAKVTEAKAANDQAAADKFQKTRDTVMNGSFLRASLFTSVLAYGVSFMAMGLGLLSGLLGWALMSLAKALGMRHDDHAEHVTTTAKPAVATTTPVATTGSTVTDKVTSTTTKVVGEADKKL